MNPNKKKWEGTESEAKIILHCTKLTIWPGFRLLYVKYANKQTNKQTNKWSMNKITTLEKNFCSMLHAVNYVALQNLSLVPTPVRRIFEWAWERGYVQYVWSGQRNPGTSGGLVHHSDDPSRGVLVFLAVARCSHNYMILCSFSLPALCFYSNVV